MCHPTQEPPKKRPRGRPSFLDDPIRLKALLDGISIGAAYTLACMAANIDFTNFMRFMKMGREQKVGKYRDFYDTVKRHEGRGALGCLVSIRAAANGKNAWQAAAWLLERRYPKLYGRYYHDHQIRGEVTTRNEHYIVQRVIHDAEALAAAEVLLERLAHVGDSGALGYAGNGRAVEAVPPPASPEPQAG